MTAKVNIFQGKDNLWYFNVQGANGEIVTQSEGYATKDNAERGVATLRSIIGPLDIQTGTETREDGE